MIKSNNHLPNNLIGKSLNINKVTLVNISFIFYFAYAEFSSVFASIGSRLLPIYSSYIPLIVLLILFILCFFLSKITNTLDFIVLFICIILIFAITYAVFPEYHIWFADDNWGLKYRIFRIDRGIYAYLFIRIISNPKAILENLKIIGWIKFLFGVYLAIGTIQRGFWNLRAADGITIQESGYNMSFGYTMAFVSVIFLYFLLSEKKKWYLIPLTISLLFILAWGSRGALLPVITYMIIHIITSGVRLTKKRVFKLTISIILLLLILANFYNIIAMAMNIMEGVGVSSRSIELLLQGQLSDDNARSQIYTMVFSEVKEIFPFGYGAFGDRPIIGKYFPWGYSHNIFLELLISFGIIGLILIVLFFINAYKILFISKYEEWKPVFSILLALNTKLLVSDSFWYYNFFWAMIALITTINFKKRYKNIS